MRTASYSIVRVGCFVFCQDVDFLWEGWKTVFGSVSILHFTLIAADLKTYYLVCPHFLKDIIF